MMTSSSSIIVTGKDEIPRLFRYSRAASSVATSWCSYRTRLDARNSSSVRQLNQPGWVYTWTFMVFSITRYDTSTLGATHHYDAASLATLTDASLARTR